MMQVKKYRAATTREALEQIKSDLGEDAFVLETKQVRTRGIFGFGGGTQIEVSAAANSISREKPTNKTTATAKSILGLTENTPSKPFFADNLNESRNTGALPKLDIRALSDKFTGFQTNNVPKTTPEKTVGVEISTEAPRIVHAKKEPVEPKEIESLATVNVNASASVLAANSGNAAEMKNSFPLQYEIERLRAEMREVKFSLGAFASRQSFFTHQSNVAFDAPVELYDSPFYEAYLELTSTGLPAEAVREMISAMIPCGGAQFTNPQELAQTALLKALPSIVRFAQDPLRQTDKQIVMAMIGATGVGKTTTLAKLAARVALREKRRVELVTLDTYRIAAVEQLRTYAEIIGAGCHVARSILELDAILSRMPQDATVLIDTAGRSPHDLADQMELTEYLREREDILKCLVLPATTHPFDASIAAKKFAMYGVNCLAVTKLDETTRAGAAVQIAADSTLPLVYICAGQRVPEDLEQASPESLTERIFKH